jgi:glycosyltransferase involved in cell wall biosynthesis
MKKISFIIPTKNEEKTLPKIVEGLREWGEKNKYQVFISITDDSHDQTRQIAKSYGVDVVIGKGRGLGFAMFRGLKHTLKYEPDVVVSLDGDGQVDLGEINSFILPILNDEADLILGSRFLNNNLIHYNYKFINRNGVRILVWILRKLTGLPITDSHGGIRAMRKEVIENLELIGTHTYVQETIIDAHENGFRVKEIPSKWLPRQAGESRVVLSIPKYVFYTLPVLILRSGKHVKWLFSAGILLILASIFDLTYVLFDTGFSFQKILDRHSLVLFLILFMLGINSFCFGFLLELLSQIKKRYS